MLCILMQPLPEDEGSNVLEDDLSFFVSELPPGFDCGSSFTLDIPPEPDRSEREMDPSFQHGYADMLVHSPKHL